MNVLAQAPVVCVPTEPGCLQRPAERGGRSELALQFFAMTSFKAPSLHRLVGIHELELTVRMFQFLQPFDIRRLYPPFLAFHL